MSNERKWCVYCHINKVNGKMYIGITSVAPNKRWGKNGRNYKHQYFYNAIEKYGWDNFEHNILYKNLTKDNACKKEIELIEKHKTTDRNFGYNILNGGICNSFDNLNNALSIQTYQYTIDGYFVKMFPSIIEAERQTGINNTAIGACMRDLKLYANEYRWYSSYLGEKIEAIDIKKYRYETTTKKQEKEVFKYSKDGIFIEKYKSVTEAGNKNKLDIGHISDCCLNKRFTCGGFIWSYRKNSEEE